MIAPCCQSAQNLLSSSLLSKNTKIKIYRTIILPVVLYGCETWALTLREERRLRVSENRVLRRKFGDKRYEVTGEWRILHNEELCALYSSPKTEMGGSCSTYRERKGAYRVLVRKSEGRRPFGRLRHRW